jgi:hypothetical protein
MSGDEDGIARTARRKLLGRPATITLEIRGSEDTEHVRLSDFITQLAALQDALGQTERLMYGVNGSVYYRIVELRQQSPAVLTIEAVRKSSFTDNTWPIVDRFFRHLSALTRSDPSVHASMDLNALQAFKNLAPTKNRRVSEFRISNPRDVEADRVEFKIDRGFAKVVKQAIGPDELSVGSVLGALEMINLHNDARFAIFQPIAGRRVICNFTTGLKGTVIAALEKYVKVTGTLHFKKWDPRPHEIDVMEIEVYPDEKDLPQITDLAGINPDIVDGRASEEFLAEARHATW